MIIYICMRRTHKHTIHMHRQTKFKRKSNQIKSNQISNKFFKKPWLNGRFPFPLSQIPHWKSTYIETKIRGCKREWESERQREWQRDRERVRSCVIAKTHKTKNIIFVPPLCISKRSNSNSVYTHIHDERQKHTIQAYLNQYLTSIYEINTQSPTQTRLYTHKIWGKSKQPTIHNQMKVQNTQYRYTWIYLHFILSECAGFIRKNVIN